MPAAKAKPRRPRRPADPLSAALRKAAAQATGPVAEWLKAMSKAEVTRSAK